MSPSTNLVRLGMIIGEIQLHSDHIVFPKNSKLKLFPDEPEVGFDPVEWSISDAWLTKYGLWKSPGIINALISKKAVWQVHGIVSTEQEISLSVNDIRIEINKKNLGPTNSSAFGREVDRTITALAIAPDEILSNVMETGCIMGVLEGSEEEPYVTWARILLPSHLIGGPKGVLTRVAPKDLDWIRRKYGDIQPIPGFFQDLRKGYEKK